MVLERPFLPWGAFESTEVTIGMGEGLMTPFPDGNTSYTVPRDKSLLGVDGSQYVAPGHLCAFRCGLCSVRNDEYSA